MAKGKKKKKTEYKFRHIGLKNIKVEDEYGTYLKVSFEFGYDDDDDCYYLLCTRLTTKQSPESVKATMMTLVKILDAGIEDFENKLVFKDLEK